MTTGDVDDAVAQRVLELPLSAGNDAGVDTVREYLVELLSLLWEQQDGFDGKRPFGNSGWDFDLIGPLVEAGLVSGYMDDDRYLYDVDEPAGRALIAAAIRQLG